ncbi:MAG: ArsA-related P-loop ATPase [Actinomycetota bacterium]
MTAAMMLDDASVIVCCGSGGVGKTTTAAVLGIEAALHGRRAVVVTIDPARRLADALGLADGLPAEPARVDLATLADTAGEARRGDGGELWAMMLDTAATFDGLVHRYADDEQQATRILENPFYRNIAGSLSGTQEYMAAEMLHALHFDDRFDLVVVDTPPSRNALDFLEAPGVLSRFLDHRLFKLLMLPARGGLRVLSPVTQPVLRTIGKVVGSDVLADSVAFFQAFAGMETGFRERADEVVALIRAPETSFVVVASPRHDTIDEAVWFSKQLTAQGVEVTAALVNRCHPVFGEGSAADAAAVAADLLDRGHTDLSALWANVAHLRGLREGEQRVVGPLAEAVGNDRVELLPLLDRDVHDLDGLARIGDHLFGRSAG